MNYLSQFLNMPAVRSVITNDFKCGYLAATVVFLLIILVLICFKIVLYLLRRNPKCSEVVVKGEDGDLIISAKVISAMVARLLESSGRLEDIKVTVRLRKKNYMVFIKAAYVEAADGMPAVAETYKPQVLELLKQQFGIENVESITFYVDHLAEIGEQDADTGL